MSRPADAEWSVVGYDQDPVPGDPEMVAEIGSDLRDMADLIERQAHEIEVVASVREWQSKAAEKFRDNAHDAVKDLRKAYHRYDVAATALGTDTHGTGYAAELWQAQKSADSALRSAQNAHGDQQSLHRQRDQLPPDTKPTDPRATALDKRMHGNDEAIRAAHRQIAQAVTARNEAADRTKSAIHRAITHDGFHDKFGDKFSHDVDAVASTVGHALKDAGEVALDFTASVGNAMLHDLGSDAMLMGGLLLSAIGGAGEVGGALLDATVVLSPAGAALNLGAGWVIAVGGTMAISGAAKIGYDAAHSDHVALSTDNGGGGGGGGGELSNRVRPPQAGDREYVVHNPSDPSDTITDYDYVAPDGRLWEEKSATGADPRINIPRWVAKNVTKKLDSFLRGRPYAQGYENAPLGMDFTEPGATPEFKAAVEKAVSDWEAKNGVDVEVRWAS